MVIYRPPNFNNQDTFFREVADSLCKASLTYDLTNLIKTEACCTKNHKSTIDLFLTNRPLSFQKNRTTETGISDYHKLIATFFKSHYTRFKPKIIYYRNYKNFNEDLFLKDLENSNLSANSDNPHENYTNLTQKFLTLLKSMPR